MQARKTAVLIHGFHLGSRLTISGQTYHWHDLVIGTVGPRKATGRATYGVQLAWKHQADLVMFSTGASRHPNGRYEAEVTYHAVQKRIPDLAASLDVPDEELDAWLQKPRVLLDTASQNTAEELQRALGACRDLHIDQLTLVTNRFHAPRVLSNALDARDRLGLELEVQATAPPNDPSRSPTVFEPSTRPDRPNAPWNETLPGIFQIPLDYQQEACAKIGTLITSYNQLRR